MRPYSLLERLAPLVTSLRVPTLPITPSIEGRERLTLRVTDAMAPVLLFISIKKIGNYPGPKLPLHRWHTLVVLVARWLASSCNSSFTVTPFAPLKKLTTYTRHAKCNQPCKHTDKTNLHKTNNRPLGKHARTRTRYIPLIQHHLATPPLEIQVTSHTLPLPIVPNALSHAQNTTSAPAGLINSCWTLLEYSARKDTDNKPSDTSPYPYVGLYTMATYILAKPPQLPVSWPPGNVSLLREPWQTSPRDISGSWS